MSFSCVNKELVWVGGSTIIEVFCVKTRSIVRTLQAGKINEFKWNRIFEGYFLIFFLLF